jgi:hypothetical protein
VRLGLGEAAGCGVFARSDQPFWLGRQVVAAQARLESGDQGEAGLGWVYSWSSLPANV